MSTQPVESSSAPPAPPARTDTAYDLCFLVDDKRHFWKNPNRGITLTDAGRASCLTWTSEGRETSRLWTDIAAVAMASASDGKHEVNNCRIRFNDGRTLTVTDTGESGTLDETRTPVYRDFARALNARLAHAPQGTIAFTAGMTEARHNVMIALLFVTTAFFVAMPLVLLFIVRDWRVLGTLAAGAALVWPLWRIVENNRPRRYDPRNPPPELME
jgi:hypothetical protein